MARNRYDVDEKLNKEFNMESVKRLCDRAVWLKDGKIKMDGNTEEVVDEYIKETK